MNSPMPTGRSAQSGFDVVIVGSGPNGLTAGVVLARRGLSVLIVEAGPTPGGGCQSAQFTLPGFVHDICAAVHPMGVLSPVFRDIHLARHGLEWATCPSPLAHPLPDGRVAVLKRSFAETSQHLGPDGRAWERMLRPFASESFIQSLLHPIWRLGAGHLMRKAQFGLTALRSCESVARGHFVDEPARALLAGCGAHSVMALNRAGTASFALVLAAVGHTLDWPCARGGSQAITRALVSAFETHGGVIQYNRKVQNIHELPASRAVVFDISPRQTARISGEQLPDDYRTGLEMFRHGPAVFKVDWALSDPIPWRNDECRSAMTVHVCGAFADVLRSESEMAGGRISERPFVLVAQQSLADRTRAPDGRHTAWAYCHVPNGSGEDMTARIEAQIEAFAPGFRDCILGRHTINPDQLQAHNPAMLGGDMAGGQNTLGQFLFRPVVRYNPYSTPNPRIFLCSSSTPPGGGVHGMCGYHAACAVMKRLGLRQPELSGSA